MRVSDLFRGNGYYIVITLCAVDYGQPAHSYERTFAECIALNQGVVII